MLDLDPDPVVLVPASVEKSIAVCNDEYIAVLDRFENGRGERAVLQRIIVEENRQPARLERLLEGSREIASGHSPVVQEDVVVVFVHDDPFRDIVHAVHSTTSVRRPASERALWASSAASIR